MLSIIRTFLPIISLVILLAILYLKIHSNPRLFLGILVFYFAFKSSTLFSAPLVVNIFGFNVYPEDLITILLAAEFFSSLIDKKFNSLLSHTHFRRAGKFYLLQCCFGLFFWIYSVGLQSAVVSWRESVLSSFLILYCFSTNQWITFDYLHSLVISASFFLSILIFIKIIVYGIGDYSELNPITGLTERAATSSGALFLLLALWLVVVANKIRGLKLFLFALLLVIEILLLQHRSVWIAAIVGVFYLILRAKESSFRKKGLGISLLLIPVYSILTFKESSIETATVDSGTLSWRVLRWKSSLGADRSWSELLFGSILGPTQSFVVDGLNVAAHNMYLSLFEKFGIIGLISYLSIIYPTKQSIIFSDNFKTIEVLITLTVCIFGIFYSFPYLFILIMFTFRRILVEMARIRYETT